MEALKPSVKINEEIKEKVVMKEYNANQKNLREDGEIGMSDENHEDEAQGQPRGIPCQTQ